MIEDFAATEGCILALQELAGRGLRVEAHAGYFEDGSDAACAHPPINSLAAFLIGAGEGAYYACAPGWTTDPRWPAVADPWLDSLPQYRRALGAPLGNASRSARGMWTRRFASGTNVSFNAETGNGRIAWGDGTVDLVHHYMVTKLLPAPDAFYATRLTTKEALTKFMRICRDDKSSGLSMSMIRLPECVQLLSAHKGCITLDAMRMAVMEGLVRAFFAMQLLAPNLAKVKSDNEGSALSRYMRETNLGVMLILISNTKDAAVRQKLLATIHMQTQRRKATHPKQCTCSALAMVLADSELFLPCLEPTPEDSLAQAVCKHGSVKMLRAVLARGTKVGSEYAKIAVAACNMPVVEELYSIRPFRNKDCVKAAQGIACVLKRKAMLQWLASRGMTASD
jgi:hypothetical protein